MPIAIAPINTSLRIIKILVDDKTKRHLENLGIFVNARSEEHTSELQSR